MGRVLTSSEEQLEGTEWVRYLPDELELVLVGYGNRIDFHAARVKTV